MSAAFSGVLGTVKSGAIDLDVEGWSADPEIEKFDSTTTADAGWADSSAAVKKDHGLVRFLLQHRQETHRSFGQSFARGDTDADLPGDDRRGVLGSCA